MEVGRGDGIREGDRGRDRGGAHAGEIRTEKVRVDQNDDGFITLR